MRIPTESQRQRRDALIEQLTRLDTDERAARLQRIQGVEDPDVFALVEEYFALPPEPDRCRTGERIGGCTLGPQLGSGGMGVVYYATEGPPLRRTVALKLIHPHLILTGQRDAAKRFRDEIKHLGKLEHQRIPRIYKPGIHKSKKPRETIPFFTMELVRGGVPITAYAKAHTLTVPDRLQLFLRVCEAVEYAHEHRIIHRDLKPTNILVDQQGRPFVLDFGLAQICDASRPPGGECIAGTPPYMSPEQVSDDFGPVEAMSDVYTLGFILYELLAERRPLEVPPNASWEALHHEILTTIPAPLNQYNAECNDNLATIVARALEKHPADRFSSVVDLQRDIDKYLASEEQVKLVLDVIGHLPPDRALGSSLPPASDALASQWLPEIGRRDVFIGRERRLSEVDERLKSHRLVTVVGPGGMGKTRLALEISNKNSGDAARDGAREFVSLELVTSRSEEAVLGALVSGLKIAPVGAGDLLSALVKRLSAFPLLLVLDNCETARSSVATIVRKLLSQCPNLRILAASQHQLGIHPIEAVYELPPLSVPDESHVSLAGLEHLESYQLFVSRARMAANAWTPEENSALTVRRLLQLTDGIPLAIAIVAAWAPLLSLTQMCEELAETPLGSIAAVDEFSSVASERHRSMLRCLEWSLGHLAKSAPNDAAGFQRLGVFAGRFTEEAVGKVCKVENPRQLLTHLIKTSLVHACPETDPRRYTLLNFTRAFARDKAKADGLHKELSERHLSFYLSLIQPTEEEGVLVVDTPASWEQDWPDLLAAAHAAPNIGQRQAVWCISRALGPFLHGRGLWSERERLNRAAVDAASRASGRSALERALIDLGIILEAQGRWPEAVHQYKLALVSANKHQTPRPTHQAMALQRLGGVLTRMGDTAAAERARKKLEEVNQLLEQPRAKARSLDEVGKTFQAHGDLGNAEAKYREAFQIRESIGDTVGLARSKENLGIVLSLQGNWPLAEKELQECLAYWASQDDSRMRGILRHHLADLCRRQGRFPEALDHCTQSLQCRKNDPKGQAVTLTSIAKIHRIQQHFDEAVAALEQSKNLCRSIGDVEGESIALDQLGGIYSLQQKWPDALAVFEGSRRLKDSAQRRDIVGLGITLDRIAQVHARCNNWTQALAAGIESLGYFKAAGRKVPAAATLMNVAMMHAAQGQKAPALNTLDDAITSLQSEHSGKAVLQEARKLRSRLDRKMRDGTPWVYWQDAALKNQQNFIRKQFDRARQAKRWPEAAASYEALAGEYTDSGRQMEAGLALNELGSVYRHLGDFARSEETIRHALTLFEDIALPLGVALSWHKLGDLFAEQCLWPKAEQAYNKSIKLKRECFDDEGEAISQEGLFDVLVKLERLEEAQRAANRAWEIMSEIGSDLQKWHPLARLLWLKATQRAAAGVQNIADRIATAFRGSRYRESTVRALQMAAAGNDWENLQALLARAGITGPTELPAPSGQGVSKLLPRISKLIQGCSSLSVASGAAFVRRVLAGVWRRH